MPIYEYQCQGCNYVFEEMQGFKDKPIKKCPSCKKNKAKRLISLSAFHLQGSGWYETDYGKKKVSSGAPPAKPDATKDANAETVTSGTPDGDNAAAAATVDSIKKDTAKAKGQTKAK